MKKAVYKVVMSTVVVGLLMGCGLSDRDTKPVDRSNSGTGLHTDSGHEVDIKYKKPDGATEKIGVWHFQEDGADDGWGLLVRPRDISATGLRLCFERYGVQGDDSASGYGEPFELEQYNDSQWTEAPRVAGAESVGWDSLLYVLPDDAPAEQQVDWEELYGELDPGSYRLVKEIVGTRSTRVYYIPFDIVDPQVCGGISCSADGVDICVPIIDGWEYAIAERSPVCAAWGINFRPKGETGWVQLLYWDAYGVCGTGLETEEISLSNGMQGSMGTYDGAAIWDFISFPVGNGYFELSNRGAGGWLPARNTEVLELFVNADLHWTDAEQ